jgi:hypothetical protein
MSTMTNTFAEKEPAKKKFNSIEKNVSINWLA